MVKTNIEVKKHKAGQIECPNCGRQWSEVDESRLDEIGKMKREVDEDYELYADEEDANKILGIPMICGHCDEEWNLSLDLYIPIYSIAIFKHTTGSDDVIKIMKLVEAEDMKVAEHLANKDAVANSETQTDKDIHPEFASHRELESIKEIGYNFSIYDFPEEFIIRQEDA